MEHFEKVIEKRMEHFEKVIEKGQQGYRRYPAVRWEAAGLPPIANGLQGSWKNCDRGRRRREQFLTKSLI